jgi:hypothetical protein
VKLDDLGIPELPEPDKDKSEPSDGTVLVFVGMVLAFIIIVLGLILM